MCNLCAICVPSVLVICVRSVRHLRSVCDLCEISAQLCIVCSDGTVGALAALIMTCHAQACHQTRVTHMDVFFPKQSTPMIVGSPDVRYAHLIDFIESRWSTCIKDTGMAIRHSRGYTFFYTAGSRNGLERVDGKGPHCSPGFLDFGLRGGCASSRLDHGLKV